MSTVPKSTFVICGFPGVGKSYVTKNNTSDWKITDSDSSKFSWIVDPVTGEKTRNPNFIKDYMSHTSGVAPLNLTSFSSARTKRCVKRFSILLETSRSSLLIRNEKQKISTWNVISNAEATMHSSN